MYHNWKMKTNRKIKVRKTVYNTNKVNSQTNLSQNKTKKKQTDSQFVIDIN